VVTIVGTDDGISAAIAALPASAEYEVSETGPFSESVATPFRGLTDRQREILETAVAAGYYENPRAVTQAELGERLSLSPGTVGDHLRTIEAHVFSRAAVALGAH
jgi:predicted DNA binding protein